MFGLPITAIFLAWSLPGAGRPGVPMRSIVVLCLLVAYNPFQYYIESGSYGEMLGQRRQLLTCLGPISHSDGDDGFGLIDELVPGLAAGLDDGVVVFENAV